MIGKERGEREGVRFEGFLSQVSSSRRRSTLFPSSSLFRDSSTERRMSEIMLWTSLPSVSFLRFVVFRRFWLSSIVCSRVPSGRLLLLISKSSIAVLRLISTFESTWPITAHEKFVNYLSLICENLSHLVECATRLLELRSYPPSAS